MGISADNSIFGRRLTGAAAFICVVVGLLGVRLYYLQVIRGSYFRDLSENNRTRAIRTAAPRGKLFDRENRVLVGNRPAFNIAVMLEDTPDVTETLNSLAKITGREEQQLRGRLSSKRRAPFVPKVVLADASREELAKVKVNSYRLPGVIVDVTPARVYPYNDLAAQLFGYAREITKKQLDGVPKGSYHSGDLIGKSGLERQFESSLRGESGTVQVEVDAMGNRRRELGIADDKPGRDLFLTIDLDLQLAAHEGLAGRKGAAVAIDPRNGEVLALASSPGFDANIFAGAIGAEDWNLVAKDKRKPLKNRAITDIYPPGSTFKFVLALAGLAEKKISKHTEFNCPGFYKFAGRRYHCHKRSGHGLVNLEKAFRVSCNAFFYKLGQEVGVDAIHRYSTALGLGAKTGIDLPGEQSGIIPSKAWKLKHLGERWYPGETLSVSIGQGFVSITPLQLAVAISTIANGGSVYQPMVVRAIRGDDVDEDKHFLPQLVRQLSIDPKIFEQVRRYSVGVTGHEEGTGKRAAIEGISIGGKTGTAQVSSLGKGVSEEFQDHAWFTAFAPAEDPTIVVAIIVENGGHGGVTAAPISKAIMEAHFRKKGMIAEPEIEKESEENKEKKKPSMEVAMVEN